MKTIKQNIVKDVYRPEMKSTLTEISSHRD